MTALSFKQVDVFTAVRFQGNPVAVVLDGAGLSTAQMQQVANWTNLSETTFVVPVTAPGADYHVRIFSPAAELPFAGHPTIGTAHALLEAGRVTPRGGRLVQQCKQGLIDVQVDAKVDAQVNTTWIGFTVPDALVTCLPDDEVDAVAALLKAQPVRAPLVVDVGPRWLLVQLADAAAVLAARPDLGLMRALDVAGGRTGVVLFGAHAPGAPADYEMRAFAPAHGMSEDPVCGSGAGSLGVYVRATGQVAAATLVLRQGQVVGRDGTIRVSVRPDAVLVSGRAVTCIEGTLTV